MEINKYIDYKEIFSKCLEEGKWVLTDYDESQVEYQNYKKIEHFNKCYEEFEIMTDECSLNTGIDVEYKKESVCFVFGFEGNDANESNPESSWGRAATIYNFRDEMFTNYEEEWG